MKRQSILSLTFALLLTGLSVFPAFSDRGFMYIGPNGVHTTKYDSGIRFYEPNQNALIAFDGKEEILLLTTDASASSPAKVLEVLPLPSKPTVTEGKMETLKTAVSVLNSKLMVGPPPKSDNGWQYGKGLSPSGKYVAPAAVIVQHQKIGPHDVSVVEVLEKEKFVEWTEANLKKLGSPSAKVPEWMKAKIEQYTANGFHWFAFDAVDLSTKPTTISPLRYRFFTPKLFYPLQITKVNGPSAVKLIVMTSEPVKTSPRVKNATVTNTTGQYPILKEELQKIDSEMDKLLDKIPSFERPHIQMWELNNPNGKDYAGDLSVGL